MCEKYVKEAVESVACQTYANRELILVDDGSPGLPVGEVLGDFDESWTKIVTHAENMGLGAARNTGFQHAKGEYILPLDSDDMIKPEFIEKCVAALGDERLGGVFTQVEIFGLREEIWSPECALPGLMAGNAIPSTIMYRRDIFNSVGGYRNDLKSVDMDFWIRALNEGWRVKRIDEPLYRYRKHEAGMSNTGQLTEVSDLVAMNTDLYRDHILEVFRLFERRYNEKNRQYLVLEEGFRKMQKGHDELVSTYNEMVEKKVMWRLGRWLQRIRGSSRH